VRERKKKEGDREWERFFT